MTTPASLTPPAAGASYRSRYPIAFRLSDDRGQAVMTITDLPEEQHMHLEISNAARAPITLAPLSGEPHAENHHFELRFRPGVLSQTALSQEARTEGGWAISKPEGAEGAPISIYFLRTDLDGLTLASDIPQKLSLPKLSASEGIGAQGTRVELRYRSMSFGQAFKPAGALEGSALFHLDLVNRSGSQYIPLDVGFAGANSVINDGRTVNTLTLRVTNIGEEPLRLLGGATGSWLTLSFLEGGEWGIAEDATSFTVGAVHSQEVNESASTAHAHWKVPQRPEGTTAVWLLTPSQDTSLAPNESLLLAIGNITTDSKSGQTNLHLSYKNIPGYWDGQFVVAVEKGPLTYDDKGRVGIGTNAPQAKLDVAGAARVDSLAVAGAARVDSLAVMRAENENGTSLTLGLSSSLCKRSPFPY